ncbi:MAG TPA: NAD(P)-dependent oxidoreductase [Pseudobdellovibrionaceae bacterium]|nr:NAD(P)-dependent oxidoreductase [Pseudobdellovibrionaceae bacterium]
MKKKKVLITDRFATESAMWLDRQPHLEIVRADSPSILPLEHLVSCQAMLIRSRTPIDEKLLKKARQLQVIITATSGFDHIDLDACTKWGITVMHTPSANIESASQLTWALVLAVANRLRESRSLMESGEWLRDKVIGLELSGRTYGIVGLGRIGSRVAKLAQAFGMNVMAYDPYLADSTFDAVNVQRQGFEELLKNSDVVSFHVPKTAETERMLTRQQLSRLSRPLILVNTSRGSVIEENDLIEALQKGWLRGAGLDVFAQEPLETSSELLKLPQVVATPHVGANTEEAFFKASQLAAQKMVSFFLDGSTSDTLPPRVPWYGATPLKAD